VHGENLYRGSSSEGRALYPEILLDRLFDSRQAVLSDGRIVRLHALKAERCFSNEWSWNEHYFDLARSWWKQHPWEALQFVARKTWVALFELRHTPYKMRAEGSDTEYPRLISVAMMAWMAFARVLFFSMLVLTVRDLWRGRQWQSFWTLALICAGWLPYFLVFVYQRHVVPLLVMSGFVLLELYLCEPRNPVLENRGPLHT
jgi:hypothetical protein